MKGTTQGVARILKATRYSWQGLKSTWQTEAAFREELPLAVVLIAIALWLDVSSVETVLLILTPMLVLIVELINSGIEAVVDRIGPEVHELSGKAKDVGSAAVFLMLLVTALTWGLIVGGRYL